MIKAKKRKLISYSLLAAGASVLSIGLATSLYVATHKQGLNYESGISKRQTTPTLTSQNKVVIQFLHNSFTDANLESEIGPTVLEFRSGDQLIFKKEIDADKTKTTEQVDISPDIPKGYELDPAYHVAGEVITVKVGQVNVIHIRPIEVILITTIQFRDGNKDINEPLKFQVKDLSQIKLLEIIPKGYKLATENEPTLRLGDLNVVAITKIRVEKHATLRFLLAPEAGQSEGRLVGERRITTYDDDTYNPKSYIPEGFEFVDQNINEQTPGGTNGTFVVRPSVAITRTTIIYRNRATQQQIGQPVVFQTTKDKRLSFGEIDSRKPDGYDLDPSFNPSTITMGRINYVDLDKINKLLTTTFIFQNKDNNNTEVANITRSSFEGRTINLQELIPVGFRLADGQSSEIQYGQTNNYLVVRESQPRPNQPVNPSPTPEPQPQPRFEPSTPRPLSEREKSVLSQSDINRLIQAGGQRVSTAHPPSPGSSLPNTNPAPLGEGEKEGYRRRLQDILTVIRNTKAGEFTADSLRSLLNVPNDDYFNDFVIPILNGKAKESGIVGPWRYETPEEARQNFEAQVSVALNSLDAEFAKGLIPKFNTSNGSYNFSFGYKNKYDNPVILRNININKSRAFAVDDQEYERNPKQGLDGSYVGWSNRDISGSYTFPDGQPKIYSDPTGKPFIHGGGIQVQEYTPNPDNDLGKKQGVQKVAFMDASNPNGVKNIINFLNQHREITGIFIRNIGSADKNQDISGILNQLPSHINKVTLFFDTERIRGLSALRRLHLDQVELYTTIQNIDNNLGEQQRGYVYGWGIDPIAFENTKFVSQDYSNTRFFDNYNSPQVQVGPIIFDIIRPDQGTTVEDLKKAFDIALNKRKSWKVFNGNFGDDGYPTKIDLSETNIKTLKGINLYGRYFKTIKLPSSGSTFELNLSDLSGAQYERILADWRFPDKPTILFGNPETTRILFKGTTKDFGRDWVKSLQGLLTGLANNSSFTTVVVENQDVARVLQGSPGWDSRFKLVVGSDADFGFNFN